MDKSGKQGFFDPRENIAFAGSPLNKLDEFRSNREWVDEKLTSPDSRVLYYHGGRVLMETEPKLELSFKSSTEAAPYLTNGSNWVLLGKTNQDVLFACDPGEEIIPSSNSQKWIDLRSVVGQLDFSGEDEGRSAIIGCAASMLNWHKAHPYCAKCGFKTEIGRAGFVRKCCNKDCEAEHFPRTDPVVIMVATHEDKCLLGRSPHFIPGVYSALAGFMEPGESIEEAVRRELWEEAGIKAGKVEYLKSQPWPFPSSLMIGCIAEALNENITFNDDELEDARWFSRKEIKEILQNESEDPFRTPTKMAIAYHLIKYWAFEKE